MSGNWTEWLVADNLFEVNLWLKFRSSDPGPTSSIGRLVNGKQGAYWLGETNPSFMGPEAPPVWRGAH